MMYVGQSLVSMKGGEYYEAQGINRDAEAFPVLATYEQG